MRIDSCGITYLERCQRLEDQNHRLTYRYEMHIMNFAVTCVQWMVMWICVDCHCGSNVQIK